MKKLEFIRTFMLAFYIKNKNKIINKKLNLQFTEPIIINTVKLDYHKNYNNYTHIAINNNVPKFDNFK
jgi:hypothetical protein